MSNDKRWPHSEAEQQALSDLLAENIRLTRRFNVLFWWSVGLTLVALALLYVVLLRGRDCETPPLPVQHETRSYT